MLVQLPWESNTLQEHNKEIMMFVLYLKLTHNGVVRVETTSDIYILLKKYSLAEDSEEVKNFLATKK